MNVDCATRIKAHVSTPRTLVRTLARAALACAVLGCASFIGVRTAAARDRAEVVLRYEVDATAVADCPGEARLRELVAVELGYDPFVAEAAASIRLRISGAAPRLVADITYRSTGERGAPSSRTLEAARCSELASSAAFAVAMAVDPDVIAAPASSGAQSEALDATSLDRAPSGRDAPSRTRATASRASTSRARPGVETPALLGADVTPGAPLAWTLSAGMRAGAGLVPGVSIGPHAGVAIGGEHWSIGAEAQAILPSSERAPFAEVSASIVRGALVPCARIPAAAWATVALCGHASVGALLGEATAVSRAMPSTDVHVAFGPRASVDFQPWDVVGFRAGAELDVAATRIHLEIDDAGVRREAWVTPAVAGLGELALLARFQ